MRVDLTLEHSPTERSDPPPSALVRHSSSRLSAVRLCRRASPSIRDARHGKVELAQSADLGNVCHIEIGDLVLSSLTTTNHGVFEPSRDSTIFTDARHR